MLCHTLSIDRDAIAHQQKLVASDGYWIDPEGRVYTVGFYGHRDFAVSALGLTGRTWQEIFSLYPKGPTEVLYSELRWVHVTGDAVYIPHASPTEAQIDALYDISKVLAETSRLRRSLLTAIETRQSVY